MTRRVVVIPEPGVQVPADVLRAMLPYLADPARLHADGADPLAVQGFEALRVAAVQLAASGRKGALPGHAVEGLPCSSVSSSSSRAGLTAKQAADIAGVSDRAMRDRAAAMQRRGEAWRDRNEWRFDEAAVRGRLEVERRGQSEAVDGAGAG